MTENTTETRTERRPKTVRQFRHAARGVLVQAREGLSLRTDATREVYSLMNGTIEEILRGRQGLTQEQQVEYLTNASQRVNESREQIAEAVERAKAQIIEQIESWDFDAALAEAASVLSDGQEFAANRDFAAHQERKSRLGGYHALEADESDAEGDTEADDADDNED